MTVKCVFSLALLAAATAMANNLQISNVGIKGRDSTTAYIQFDIRWENSWRHSSGETTPYFHDAAWVFFKVQPEGETNWYHAVLEGSGTDPSGFGYGSGTAVEFVVPDDRVGFSLRRAADGTGTTDVQKVRAVWNFATNNLTKHSKVSVRAFGIEMVYVAQGSFYVGSGGDGYAEFKDSGTGGPFNIASEDEITVGEGAGELFVKRPSGYEQYPSAQHPLPADFPKGYNAFYCMKYEVSQGQYASFLNTLTRHQQATRSGTTSLGCYMPGDAATPQNRGTIKVANETEEPLPRVYEAEAPDRAANWLSWGDLGAFLDWAGLRPMTEFEYEKACRGPMTPRANEYAWDTYDFWASTLYPENDGSGTEVNANGHVAAIGFFDGPLRVGIFAQPEYDHRLWTGASYWGILDMSGSVCERAVTALNDADYLNANGGYTYTGAHGDGTLTSGGNFDVTGWAEDNVNRFIGYRGGHYGATYERAQISDRSQGYINFGSREASFGGRGVRTAPVTDAPGSHNVAGFEEFTCPRWAGGFYDGWADTQMEGYSDMRLNAGTIFCVW